VTPLKNPFTSLLKINRKILAEKVAERWPIVKYRLAINKGRGGVSAAMNITGTTIFVPVPINAED